MPDTAQTDLDALLRLVHAAGPLAPRRRLLERHPGPAAALAAGHDAWREAGLDATQRAALRAPDPARHRSQAWLAAAPGRHLVGWHDPDYPALLRRMSGPPLALFVDGDPLLLWRAGVAVVGSRAPTAGGLASATGFARRFAAQGLAVFSGLAGGIDAAAHLGALEAGGITVAVLGSGIDVPYPRCNAGLYARIAAEGAVVSEYPPGTPARRAQFPSRNRIVAGLALGTLVVEAAYRSGALITARLAGEAGREVFAVPGSIRNPMARGCHRLLRDGAMLVESPDEAAAALGPAAAGLADALRGRLAAPIQGGQEDGATAVPSASSADPDYNRLWQALGHDPSGMDELIARTGLTVARASAMLLAMELDGRIDVAHGRYCRKS
ncbi:DNA-processing protein DprA [Luteimonas sp. FCS-9]|uniref:DNA-processing protein DprA n=1 Tax=Luteimonas sp. FCS-9 TaxID=1547516 RepID=UPI00063E7FFA|nr:DNA-processing protein DprA [Luteimonas sp. FCS-9]KLJ00107.1 DNA processing protein DprA [Luteimonas sp. FCS-9]